MASRIKAATITRTESVELWPGHGGAVATKIYFTVRDIRPGKYIQVERACWAHNGAEIEAACKGRAIRDAMIFGYTVREA